MSHFEDFHCISAVARLKLFLRKAPSYKVSRLGLEASSWADLVSTSAVTRFKIQPGGFHSFVPDDLTYPHEVVWY